jgi:hypothetical protein
MMKPEAKSAYITIAVPTVVGGVLKLSTIPPIETGMAATLKDMTLPHGDDDHRHPRIPHRDFCIYS